MSDQNSNSKIEQLLGIYTNSVIVGILIISALIIFAIIICTIPTISPSVIAIFSALFGGLVTFFSININKKEC